MYASCAGTLSEMPLIEGKKGMKRELILDNLTSLKP